MKLKGCTALVTGANRGIGAAFVDAFLAAGARKIYAGVRNPDAYAPPDGRVTAVKLDVTADADVAAAVAACGDVDVLVNNAGVNGSSGVVAGDLAAAGHEIDVNYLGLLRMCRAFAPVLAANGGGAMVNLLSILSRVNLPRAGSYCASKAAAYSATQAFRAELAAQRTLVVAVCPGTVDTEMTRLSPGPKMAPEAVATAALDAVEAEAEEIYPGDMAAGVAADLDLDRKAVEQRFAAMLPAATDG